MSEDKYHHTSKTRDKSLRDLNLLGLWSQGGSDGNSTIKEESQSATNEPVLEEEPNPTKKIVLFGVLTVLALLIAVTWVQAPKIYQAVKEAGKNSIEQLIFR